MTRSNRFFLAACATSIALAGSSPAQSCDTRCASVNAGFPKYANGESYRPAVSGDGRFVAFASTAPDLVPGDTTDSDVFMFDRSSGLLSVLDLGAQGLPQFAHGALSLSFDGNVLAFQLDAAGPTQVRWHDRAAATTTLVSATPSGTPGNSYSLAPRVSSDGRFIAYQSRATDIVAVAPATPGAYHMLLFDRVTGTTVVADSTATGVAGNGSVTSLGSLSADGRYLAFMSQSTNLDPSDTNTNDDVYLRDNVLGSIQRISLDPAGVSFTFTSGPAVSADGQVVYFYGAGLGPVFGIFAYSTANHTSTLTSAVGIPLACSTTGQQLLYQSGSFTYLIDFPTTDVTFISERTDGQGVQIDYPAMSAAGDVVCFSCPSPVTAGDFTGHNDVFVRSLPGTNIRCISAANGAIQSQGADHSAFYSAPHMSNSGRYLLFDSAADNLVAFDPRPSSGGSDVFFADRQSGLLTRVPTTPQMGHLSSRALSGDGQFVLVTSNNNSYVYSTSTWQRVLDVPAATGSLSHDGHVIAYPYSGPEPARILVYDWFNATPPQEVVVATGGVALGGVGRHARVSGNARYVAYSSSFGFLVAGDTNGSEDIFLFDRVTSSVARLSVATGGAQANSDCFNPTISDDGRFIAFESEATNLVSGDTNGTNDVFVRDRVLGTTTRATVNDLGTEANQYSSGSVMSPDGRHVTFWSYATNLAPGDTNRWADVFVRDIQLGVTRIASVNSGCVVGDGVSWYPSAFVANRFVAFSSFATTLVAGDTNGFCDVFVRECTTDSQCGMPVSAAFCFGDGALADHTTPCPCGNKGATGNGCGHSFDANGANMTATGTPANDDVVLHSQFEPVSSFTLFLQHAASGDGVFHDGVLCAGGALTRLRGRAAIGGEAFFPNSLFALDSTTTLSQRGGVTVGSGARRYYSAWYRNATTTFCPPATANVTNGWILDW